MIGPEVLAITYGLSSAISWEAGDFSAGFASRNSGVRSVVLFSQLIGAVFLILLAGICFGLFFVLIDMTCQETVLWPLLGTRFTSLLVVQR